MHEYCILINFEPKISLKKNFYLIALVLFDLISWQFDVQMKSKHTSIRIIHIKLKCFAKKKNISWNKRKENTYYNWMNFLCENKISELRLCLCKQTNICMSV